MWYNKNMSDSKKLRQNLNQHKIKNTLSNKMDKDIIVVIRKLIVKLEKEYPKLTFQWLSQMHLSSIIADLSVQFPQYADSFSKVHSKATIKPDGGFLFCTNKKGEKRLILVSEVKRQGTNDERAKEGKKKQAQGNAIERLGKNLTGIKAICKAKGNIPFVCFGHGIDFAKGSTILDRVITINEFFPLNKTFVAKTYLPFEPVSLYFREKAWSQKEMFAVLYIVSKEAIESTFI
jgi:type II restriction enzyme